MFCAHSMTPKLVVFGSVASSGMFSGGFIRNGIFTIAVQRFVGALTD